MKQLKIILYYVKDDTLKIPEKESEVMHEIYELYARVPEITHIEEYINKNSTKPKDQIIEYFKDKNYDKCINKIKKNISMITTYVPLYDIYTKNLYLITCENVYNRVVYQYYRFTNKQMVTYLKNKHFELSEKSKSETDILLIREVRKLGLMIDFLNQLNLEVLEKTYIYVFYNYSNEVGKNITLCTRPSFMSHFTHIEPYYTRSELINLALNMEFIKPNNTYYDNDKIISLCNKIKENDITANILLEHQKYIIENNGIGLVQYYSLQGSFFMNQYLRGLTKYVYRNKFLESPIKELWKLIKKAPSFDQSYTLYRFIKSDDHLKHLQIGDVYTEKSFISTTRDPFYRSDTYKFGFILIKIKIPKGKEGVGLCVETFSHFQKEQEIILAPLTKLKLVKKDKNTVYYHTDKTEESKVETRYEFVYINNDSILFEPRIEYNNTKYMAPVDFLSIKGEKMNTLSERIHYFISKYVNPLYQFNTMIGNKIYTIVLEWYDSTDAYKSFYAIRTNNGFSMYTIDNNYVSFIIELGENNGVPFMYVNYYFRYSMMASNSSIDQKSFIDFLSKMSYYFKVQSVIIYSDYVLCNQSKKSNDLFSNIYKYGNYILDFYNYLKYSKKKYKEFDTMEIKPKFSYYELDRLKKTDPLTILKKTDRDELYQIYIKAYIINNEKENNMASFFIWLVENYCVYVKYLVQKMERIYIRNNPFDNDNYILDSFLYLYNRSLINSYEPYKESNIYDVNNDNIYDMDIPKNNYRTEIIRSR